MAIGNQESLYRRIMSKLHEDPKVGVAGVAHRGVNQVFSNLTEFHEDVSVGLFLPEVKGMANEFHLNTFLTYLSGQLPQEGIDLEKLYDRYGTGGKKDKIDYPFLPYRESIGNIKKTSVTEYEVTDPDALSKNHPAAKTLREQGVYTMHRDIIIRPFPNEALARLYVEYNQNRDNYEWNDCLNALVNSVHKELYKDAEQGVDLSKYLVPKK